MPMYIILVGDTATLNAVKSLDSRYKHSRMTALYKLTGHSEFNHVVDLLHRVQYTCTHYVYYYWLEQYNHLYVFICKHSKIKRNLLAL